MFTLPRPKHLVGQKSKASIGDFAKLFRNANLLAVYGVASAVMGRLADKVGNGKILLVSLAVMFAGIGLTCASSLAVKLLGVGFVTYGFFGAHSTASAWVGKLSTADKVRISAGYMLVYYVGASVVGTAGKKFLKAFDWTGVALFMTAVLSIALILSVKLLRST